MLPGLDFIIYYCEFSEAMAQSGVMSGHTGWRAEWWGRVEPGKVEDGQSDDHLGQKEKFLRYFCDIGNEDKTNHLTHKWLQYTELHKLLSLEMKHLTTGSQIEP